MKPVELEQYISAFRKIIADADGVTSADSMIRAELDSLQADMKQLDDGKESKGLVILLSVILLPLVGYLVYKGFYWPSLIAVMWLGALLYYRIHERSLSITTLSEKAKITPNDVITKVKYLRSGVHQKQERLRLTKVLCWVFWPFAVFMAQLAFYEGLNLGVLWLMLAVIFVLNYFFWNNFFKEPASAFDSLDTQLTELSNALLLNTGTPQGKIKLYQSEEEE